MSSDPIVDTLKEWFQVSMHQSMRDFILYARNSGLSMSHLGALFHIHHKGSSGVTELGDQLGVTSAASSQMLERLVQQDLILRTEDPDDRRVKQIILTDEGNRVVEEGIRAREAWLDDLAMTLSEDEREIIQEALEILIDKVNILKEPV
ncbi:MAG: MarR family transcriptional regulator [Anaerolineales bacterium]|nr:MarR family transcriptional regulator [Anaerolineales bacterium]